MAFNTNDTSAQFESRHEDMLNFIEDIEAGVYDHWLRQIAQAAYIRAQKIGDAGPKRVPKKKRLTKPDVSVDDGNQIVTIIPNPVNAPVNPVPYSMNTFVVKGKHYSREEFLHKSFVVRTGTYNDGRYDGQIATITGAGAKAFKVEFSDKSNAPTGPGGNKGEVTFIWYDRVPYLFGESE